MIFLGNYSHWINPNWLTSILNTAGCVAPRDVNFSQDGRKEMHESEKQMYEVYGTDGEFFNLLESSMLDFEIDPPWIDEEFHWWITKMKPGQFIPVHCDGPKHLKGKRYWMPLTDWELGHIFMYEDRYVKNYKAGDLWMYEQSMAPHGAINIGHNVRLILQVSTFGN